VVADRGLISAPPIAALEARGLEYIPGGRERTAKAVRTLVLDDATPSVPLVIPRQGRPDTALEAKAVILGKRRYIVCRNLAQAEKDAAAREAIVANLRQALRRGDKALVGNAGYRRFLKAPAQGFAIDQARVPKTRSSTASSCCAPTPASIRSRRCCATARCKASSSCSVAPSRCSPPGRSSPNAMPPAAATIRGHGFCSFLALLLQKALADRCAARGFPPEWADVRRDLDRLQELEVAQDGKRLILRTPTTGGAGKLFQTLAVALPPAIRAAAPTALDPVAEAPPP
jgi:hypothetical protein